MPWRRRELMVDLTAREIFRLVTRLYGEGRITKLTLRTHMSTAFQDIVFPWEQGGVLDQIPVASFGIVILVAMVVLVLLDSEVALLSDDDVKGGCSCEEAGSGQDSGEQSEQCTVEVPSGQRSSRRLRYRSRSISKLRGSSGPGRQLRLRRSARDRTYPCERCKHVQSGHASQAP